MTAAITEAGSPAAPEDRRPRWPAWALAAICVVAGALYAWKIGAGQIGNAYYTAAAKSMTASFSNFLFGSFDPIGVVTVDKPPMALWPQALAVAVFGAHGWVVLLPQVIEGVAAVFLLHRTVRLWAGEKAALLAAGIFALTPITVAINRDNNPDTLLVLLLVAAAYAFTRSVRAESSAPRTRWLLWCAFFIGCGFLTKMLQAWIIVPGVALAYLVGTTAPWKRRVLDLLAAAGVLIASSFWWVALHAWWPGEKPYVGGSTDGSAWDLIIGYNGLSRVFGGEGPGPGGNFQPPSGMEFPAGGGGPGAGFGGQSGITRMFDDAVGGQISWLLPLSLLVLVVVAVAGVLKLRAKVSSDPAERAGWFLWGSWLVVTALVFSLAQGIFHPYYTTMLAPAVAAISAAGLVRFWRAQSAAGLGWVLLPLAVAITAVWTFIVVSRTPAWHGWTRWAVVVLAVVAIGGVAAAKFGVSALGRPALVVGLVAVLLTPAVWSTATAAEANNNGVIPAAGPADGGFGGFPGGSRGPDGFPGGQLPGGGFPGGQNPGGQLPGGGLPGGGLPGGGLPGGGVPGGGFPGGTPPTGGAQPPGLPGGGVPMPGGGFPGDGRGGPRGGGMPGFGVTELSAEQRRVLDYAKRISPDAEITLAVNGGSMAASAFIIGSDETVIGMGGFSGMDNAPNTTQLDQWTTSGRLRFILSGSGGRGGGFPGGPGGGATQQRQQWIEQNCAKVDQAAYGGSTMTTQEQPWPMGQAQTLYDCK
ncbi:4-amino-4-deoxy-L-arabinose transferase-like glycosyltransferase [Actinokineospora baliensis]|uniref:ArnT family glycosyltransferase n=1 Tax=Actinokineospora baliensis TaxID=547056 RepID=UPI001959ECC7|nr:glycosyltransferase family 39 protein [Actinokineospora baliensis]MBM7774409.1 4-amino-4-deoxy-L-arabinose transferase-like glycosyltransferase [Actinokineospora baliensis]